MRWRQFERSLYQALSVGIRIKKSRATPYYLRTNGKLERCHRTFLLGLLSVIRENSKASPAEILYGKDIRLPKEFFEDTNTDNVSPTPFES